MFDTALIEFFSRMDPISVFAFWLPLIMMLSWWTLSRSGGMAWYAFSGLVLLGWLQWTVAEYVLHRHVFHWVGRGRYQRRFHFIFHGVHHDFPQDVRRLVMPLGVSIPIGLLQFLVMDALLPRPIAVALIVGFASGYVAYDTVHYYTHHLKARSRVGKWLKRYHMVHHFTGVDGLYGVSQPLWDYVIGTQTDRRAAKSAS